MDRLREQGLKVGCIKLRVFRPFPHQKLRELLKSIPRVAVLDRAASFGAEGGPVFMELRSALYGVSNPPDIINFLYGLGGRDINYYQIEETARNILNDKIKEPFNYIGLRE